MPAVPHEDDGLPPRDEDGRFTAAGHHEPAPEPTAEDLADIADAGTAWDGDIGDGPWEQVKAELAAPEPEPEMVKVRMHNATHGAPHPGAVITLPADRARALIAEGLADRVPA